MDNLKRNPNEYDEVNSLLKSLNAQRKKKIIGEEGKESINKSIQKDENKEEEEKKKNDSAPVIFTDGKVIFMTPLDFISPLPFHILTFRQLLYEDLQNIPNRPKTLISALFTTFCVENSFLQPIINSGIKTCLVVNSKSPKIEKISNNFTIISPALPDK